MSRQDEARLSDIVEAIGAIRDHLTRGDLHDGLVYDAVRVRLIEIGEAVVAQARQAEAIAVGHGGSGPLRAALIGSITYQIIHRSPLPVLVVPDDEDEGPA